MSRAALPSVPRWLVLSAFAVTFFFTFLLHLAVLRAEFVWDDLQITADDYIHDASHWSDVLTFRTLQRDILDNNRPAMLLTLMSDAALWGRNPVGYHITNVMLHAANAALLCYLTMHVLFRLCSAQRLELSPRWIAISAIGAALLFAVHPLVVEAVSVVAFREDLQATFFILAALVVATRLDIATRRFARAGIVVGSLLFVILAIATKESAIAAPVLLFAYWVGCRTAAPVSVSADRAWKLLMSGAVVVVVAFLVARFTLPPAISDVYVSAPRRIADSAADWFVAQSRINAFHFERVFHLEVLSSDYTPQSLQHIGQITAMMVNVIVLVLLGWLAWRNRLARLGVVLVVAGMAAVSNLAPLYNPIADRYLYLPLAGAALIVAALLAVAGKTMVIRLALLGVTCIALAILASRNLERQRVFHDDVALWNDALRKTPSSVTAHNLRGWALYAAGQYAPALASFEQALKNSGGTEPDSWAAGALACFALGETAEAERTYRRAVELQPRFRNPRFIKRCYFWRDEYLQRLAVIARPTGLWIESPAQPDTPATVMRSK